MCIGLAFISRIRHIGQATFFVFNLILFFFFFGGGRWWMMNGWWMDNDVIVIHAHHMYVDIAMLSKNICRPSYFITSHLNICVPNSIIQIIHMGLAMLSQIMHGPNYLLMNKLFSIMHKNTWNYQWHEVIHICNYLLWNSLVRETIYFFASILIWFTFSLLSLAIKY